jgi:nitrous oxidase accessory protein NosD
MWHAPRVSFGSPRGASARRPFAKGIGILPAPLAFLAMALAVAGCSSGGMTVEGSTPNRGATACTSTLSPRTHLVQALAGAAPGDVLCLRGGSYRGHRIPAAATQKSADVTIKSAPGESALFTGELAFDGARHLRVEGLAFRSGLAFTPAASHVEVIGNDLTGPGGIFFFGDPGQRGSVESVLIEGNHIHDIAYTGPQAVYRGYGIKSIGTQRDFTVKNNTIESVAADYIQTDQANDWTVEGNTFLGPSLVAGHPEEHQDLWQVYAGGKNIVFSHNVARDTGTSQSLLFQLTYPGDRFSHVTVVDNLFDHDSRGYSCQIYQANGLLFRENTVVGSRWGCLFRDDDRYPPGSGYRVQRNVFAARDGYDMGVEGGAGNWGAYEHNVTADDTAIGADAIRNWVPDWADTTDYQPLGLPIEAGYTPQG